MFKIDSSYCEYYGAADEQFPMGKAVNTTDAESYDGTAWLAAFFNQMTGFFQSLWMRAFGAITGISGAPDCVGASDGLKAIDKIIADAHKFVATDVTVSGKQEFAFSDLGLDATRAYDFAPVIAQDDSHFRSCFAERKDASTVRVSVWSQDEDGQMHNGAWNYITTGGAESSIVNEGEVGAMECDYDGGGHLESIAINLACFDAGEYVAP